MSADFWGLLGHGLAGMMMGGGLIIAIGAQNALVLRQGLKNQHVLPVVIICVCCDALLIIAGAYGMGHLVESNPAITNLITWFGVAFILTYSFLAAKRAFFPKGMEAIASSDNNNLRPVILSILAVSLLNPHVYLDTVVLLGSIANQRSDDARLAFVLGAIFASTSWFFGVGFCAKFLQPLFARPQAWRILDGCIAIMMAGIAISLI